MTGKYHTYSNYKQSGLDYYGEIPEHWYLERIKFNSYVKGRQGWQNLRADEYQEQGPFLVTGSHFNNDGGVDWEQCYHISEERYLRDSDIWVNEHDVLITKDGTIGKVAYITTLPDKACLNSHLLIIRDLQNKYNQRFLFYLLGSSCFKGFIPTRQTGTTFFGITQEAVEEFPLLLSPIEEQYQIANFLDHETAKIDTLIEKQQQLIKLLKEKRQAVISHAVTKGLNPNAPMRDSGVEWLGEVPAHWDVSKLKYLSTQIVDGAHFTPTYVDEGVPFLRVTDVQSTVIDKNNVKYIPVQEHEELIKRCKPEMGDLLLSKNGTIGIPKVVDWEWEFSIFVSLCLIKLYSRLDARYAYYYFLTHEINEQISSLIKQSTVINLHLDKIQNFVFTLPPLEEQKEIVEQLNAVLGVYDLQVGKAEQLNDLLRERRTALISAAVTGKIDVRNWKAPEQSATNKEVAA